MPNMRKFLDKIKNSNPDNPRGVSIINTPSSYTWEFRGHDYGKKFLDEELIYFVQSITLPELAVDSGGTAGTEIQNTSVPSMRMAASQTFQMEILETKVPIIEEHFLEWMLEAREPHFHDNKRAYTYANIEIMFKEKKLKYMLFGCRPTSCETINPSQRDTSLVRKITFNVDFIYAELTNTNSYQPIGEESMEEQEEESQPFPEEELPMDENFSMENGIPTYTDEDTGETTYGTAASQGHSITANRMSNDYSNNY